MKKYCYLALAAILAGAVGCTGDGALTPLNNAALVATFAGAADSGTADGTGTAARFNNPVNVVVDAQGNVYVADFDNSRIRRITPAGVVTTLTVNASFDRPFGLAIGPGGELYAQTDANDLGARDNTTGSVWLINTISGNPQIIARDLGRPRGLATLPDGRIILSDLARHTLRIMSQTTGATTLLAGGDGTAGFAEGTGAVARFSRPYGVVVHPNGNILVADQDNNRIRQVTTSGIVTTYAGTGVAGYLDGQRLQARFNRPQALAVDADGNVYVSDNDNHRIRRISSAGQVTTVAGDGVAGFADGSGTAARFFGQEGIAVSPNGDFLYVADGNGGNPGAFHRVRRIDLR